MKDVLIKTITCIHLDFRTYFFAMFVNIRGISTYLYVILGFDSSKQAGDDVIIAGAKVCH